MPNRKRVAHKWLSLPREEMAAKILKKVDVRKCPNVKAMLEEIMTTCHLSGIDLAEFADIPAVCIYAPTTTKGVPVKGLRTKLFPLLGITDEDMHVTQQQFTHSGIFRNGKNKVRLTLQRHSVSLKDAINLVLTTCRINIKQLAAILKINPVVIYQYRGGNYNHTPQDLMAAMEAEFGWIPPTGATTALPKLRKDKHTTHPKAIEGTSNAKRITLRKAIANKKLSFGQLLHIAQHDMQISLEELACILQVNKDRLAIDIKNLLPSPAVEWALVERLKWKRRKESSFITELRAQNRERAKAMGVHKYD